MKTPKARSLAMAALFLMTGSRALAEGLNCVVGDPQGDALWELSTDNIEVPPFQDIVQIQVARLGESIFTFAMDVAGDVPAAPTFVLPAVSQMIWVWRLDTDPTTAPTGYPLAPGVPGSPEFLVRILWDGDTFRGEVVDRRPLLTGGSAIILQAPFNVSGATLSISVDSEVLGNPSSFRWGALTIDRLAAQQGNNGTSALDEVSFTQCQAP